MAFFVPVLNPPLLLFLHYYVSWIQAQPPPSTLDRYLPSWPGRRVAGYPVFHPLIGAAKAACRPVSCNSIRFVVSSSALHSGHFCWSVVIVWSLYARSQSRATTIHYVCLTGLQEAIVGAGHKTRERPSRNAFEYSAPSIKCGMIVARDWLVSRLLMSRETRLVELRVVAIRGSTLADSDVMN